MLISKGKVSTSEPWQILEVALNQAPDVLAIRLSKELKRIRESAEVLVPFKRNPDGNAEWIIEHVYVRGVNGSLSRLARTPGIDFIRKETAEPDWIAQLLRQEKAAEPRQLSLGLFVRVLAGPCARLCGHITSIRSDQLTVTIKMRTKSIRLHTIPPNLQVLDCPPDHQVFFYQRELFS